ncbi:ABC transporter permease [Pseudolysobacter antarcticus]|uniref:Transport permease protein n=1 Tax=Pseudolysobacter antarcticus TaxID=2511995 RepID=A0A411HHQ6_9GAMM|nr:ABC transporter permease [Pseudolysobacter antarcticus]QBB69930.1 ABC transporter permease [Pseudolysobacter antarcticus]
MNTSLTFPRGALIASYALEVRYEFIRLLRTPSFAVPTLLFPAMFYVLFGVLMGGHSSGDNPMAHYLLATYCVFGVMAPGLFGFGITVATERERGWLALKRVAPMPAGAYLGAKMLMAMLFAFLIFVTLAILSSSLGGVRLLPMQWLGLMLLAVFGVLPFCALGLVVGSYASAQAAPAIINLIYLPMAFLSGLWMPLRMLPNLVAQIAPLWPPYHLSQLTLSVIGQGSDGFQAMHGAVLVVMTVTLFVIAQRRLQRAG